LYHCQAAPHVKQHSKTVPLALVSASIGEAS
jgi:hypothetical protein